MYNPKRAHQCNFCVIRECSAKQSTNRPVFILTLDLQAAADVLLHTEVVPNSRRRNRLPFTAVNTQFSFDFLHAQANYDVL